MSSLHFQVIALKNSHFEFLPSMSQFWPVFGRMTRIYIPIYIYLSIYIYVCVCVCVCVCAHIHMHNTHTNHTLTNTCTHSHRNTCTHTYTSLTPPCKHVYTLPTHAQPSHCPLLWPHASQLVLLTVPLSYAMSLWQNHSNRCDSSGCHSKWMLVFASQVILTSLAGTGKHDPEKRNSPTVSAWSPSVIFLLARSHS